LWGACREANGAVNGAASSLRGAGSSATARPVASQRAFTRLLEDEVPTMLSGS